jgi:uncharacterized protein YbjT (DUF2867 family)
MKKSPDGSILVLGGTGHVGRQIVRGLQEKGRAVRILTRNADHARRIVGAEPQISEGDVESSDSVRKALSGASGLVISISAFSPTTIRRLVRIERDAVIDVLGQAYDAGISRVVYLSVFDVRQGLKARWPASEMAAIKAGVEETLARTRFNWTVFGPAPSTDLFFRMIRGNTMVVPGGGPRALPTVAPRELGEICARAVLRDDLRGRRFRVVGPEAMSFPDAAKRISQVFGRQIVYRKLPLFLPRAAALLTRSFARINDKMMFMNRMLGFDLLLNEFPQEIAADVPNMHRLLVETFGHAPVTLEMEAARWISDRGGTR